MTRLSSRSTLFLKWMLPATWLLILGGVGVAAWLQPDPDPVALGMVCVMPLFLGLVYRYQIWPLADAVDDVGDALQIRRRGIELRIPLAEIVNVSVPNYSRSRRISLRLRRAGQMGDEIAFLPVTRLRWNPFARDPIVEDLIRRVDAARIGAAR